MEELGMIVDTKIGRIANPVERFFAFCRERDAVRQRRAAGLPKPWTEDSVIQSYRFCNIRREDDRVTQWIRENWREPYAQDPDLWFAMVVARLLNQPESLTALGWPVPWSCRDWLGVLKARKDAGQRNFNAAYIVSTNGRPMAKELYLADEVLEPLWRARERLRPQPGDTLGAYHILLGQFQGLGSFMTAQVIADLKYAPPLAQARDWHTFAASGPGSRRGLNRVLGRPVEAPWKEDDWRTALGRLRTAVEPMFAAAGMEMVHNQDLQNCLCEVFKYYKALDGGRPKQRYGGADEKEGS